MNMKFMLESRFSVYVNVILHIQTEHFKAFISSIVFPFSSVTTFALNVLQDFPALVNSTMFELFNNLCEKKNGWGTSMFENKPKQQSQTTTKH